MGMDLPPTVIESVAVPATGTYCWKTPRLVLLMPLTPAEGGKAGAGGRVHRLTGLRRLAQGIVLIVAEVEQLVLADRTADGGAEAVIVEARIGTDALLHLGLVHRIQIPVLQVFEDRAMNLVRTGLHDRIENAAGSAAEFRAELVLHDVELGNRFVRDIHLRTRRVVVVVHHAIDIEGVILGPLTGDAGTGTLADAAGTGDAGAQQAEVVNSGAVYDFGDACRRHVHSGSGIISGLQLSRRSVQQRRCLGNFHGGVYGSHRQGQVYRRRMI